MIVSPDLHEQRDDKFTAFGLSINFTEIVFEPEISDSRQILLRSYDITDMQ